ncbi:MAG TPA: SURF1 family protein [Gemmatimonadales bacterium]|nr:SURF1 family protein [Gemmatimonadales bacterium]
MSRFRRYAVATLTVLVAAVAIRLGIWQLDRLEARKGANAVLLEAREAEPLDLNREAPTAGHQATAMGEFDSGIRLLLRNRVSRQAPGVHVVSLFRTTGGAPVWVLRGFVPAADGVHPAVVPAPTSGEVTISGELQPLPHTDDGGGPLVIDGDTTWQRLDVEAAAGLAPEAAPVILYLAGGEAGPGRLREVEPPILDNGPHLSYAFQWFAIACASLAFGVLVLRTKPVPSDRGPVPPP